MKLEDWDGVVWRFRGSEPERELRITTGEVSVETNGMMKVEFFDSGGVRGSMMIHRDDANEMAKAIRRCWKATR